MDLAAKAYEELAYFFRSFDPLHEREKEIFATLGYIDVQYLAPRITAETCMAVGLMYEICPPSSQFAAFNKMTCTKDLVIYPDFGHESLPGLDDRVYEYLAVL
jgi:cephalosporin-C deacetylase